MKKGKITIGLVSAIGVLLCLYFFMFQVRETEMVIHYRPPGKVLRVINAQQDDERGPGLYFRLPPPIDEVKRYDRRIRVLDGPLAQTQLKDEHQVIISVYAAWRVSDPVVFQKALEGDEDRARDSLKQVIFSETSKAVSDLTFDDLVSLDEKRLQFESLERQITEGVRKAIEERPSEQYKGYGLALVAFGIRRIAIPESVTAKVFERMKKEREREAADDVEEGKKIKREKIAEARKEAERTLAQAEEQSKKIRSEGEREEAAYYETFKLYPDLAIFMRRLEALRNIAEAAREAGTPITFVLDTRTEPLAILYRGPQGENEAGGR